MSFFKNMFSRDNKNLNDVNLTIVSPVNGEIIPLEKVNDEIFSKELMGKTLAIELEYSDKVVVTSPASGTLTTIFPTGHAFGITTDSGVEILIHIGINTVESEGHGFTILNHEKGAKIQLGNPIVEVDVDKLTKSYELPIMIVITNSNGKEINFKEPSSIQKGESILK